MAQRRDGLWGFFAAVDQFFAQSANNTVVAGVHLPDVFLVLAGSFDDTAGGSVDYGSDAAGLCIEGILLGHAKNLKLTRD